MKRDLQKTWFSSSRLRLPIRKMPQYGGISGGNYVNTGSGATPGAAGRVAHGSSRFAVGSRNLVIQHGVFVDGFRRRIV